MNIEIQGKYGNEKQKLRRTIEVKLTRKIRNALSSKKKSAIQRNIENYSKFMVRVRNAQSGKRIIEKKIKGERRELNEMN